MCILIFIFTVCMQKYSSAIDSLHLYVLNMNFFLLFRSFVIFLCVFCFNIDINLPLHSCIHTLDLLVSFVFKYLKCLMANEVKVGRPAVCVCYLFHQSEFMARTTSDSMCLHCIWCRETQFYCGKRNNSWK